MSEVRRALRLALASLLHRPLLHVLIVLAVAVVAFLPLATDGLVARWRLRSAERAESTPLVVGPPGSRFELMLQALHFRPKERSEMLSLGLLDALPGRQRAEVLPLHLRHRADGLPLVGAPLEYHAFRGLRPATGTLPLRAGDAVLGSAAARRLGKKVGDTVLTRPGRFLDLAGSYPLRLHVTGVLAPTLSRDDHVVFCDLTTCWIADGLFHGHDDVDAKRDRDLVLEGSRPDGLVLSDAVTPWVEITEQNLHRFHLHGARADLPVSAGLLLPARPKDHVILATRLGKRQDVLAIEPARTQAEVETLVFRIRGLLRIQTRLVLLAMAAVLTVVSILVLRLRRPEIRTLLDIGASRARVAAWFGTELLLLVGGGLGLGASAAWLCSRLADLDRLLFLVP